MKIYIDAKDTPLGRIGSFAAKSALKGDEVFILNAEEAIISGNRKDILDDLTNLKNKGGNSLKGPKIPRPPARLLKRLIRGMLPWDRTRGEEAHKRIICYSSKEFDITKVEAIKLSTKLPLKYMKLNEVSRLI